VLASTRKNGSQNSLTPLREFLLLLALAAACAGPARPASAQDPLDWSVPPIDPTRLSSLPLRSSDARVPEPGRWRVEGTLGYFNLASPSWHITAIHSEYERDGQPVTSDELRVLETRHPSDEIYNLDVEGWQLDLNVSRGLGRGYALSLHIPWMEVGSPHWDAISSEFHHIFGIGQGPRDILASGQTMVYVYSDGRYVERSHELVGSGVADVSLAVSGPIGRALGASHRWAGVVEAPTGDRDGLWGSGGWDLGLRWFGDWRWSRWRIHAAAAYNWLDDSGGWLGIERADTWQTQAEVFFRIADGASLRASLWYGSSPLADFSDGAPGDPSPFLDLGAHFRIASRWWIAANLGENHVSYGTTPDFTLQLQLGASLGRDRSPP
jgi:hypothetical protein